MSGAMRQAAADVLRSALQWMRAKTIDGLKWEAVQPLEEALLRDAKQLDAHLHDEALRACLPAQEGGAT